MSGAYFPIMHRIPRNGNGLVDPRPPNGWEASRDTAVIKRPEYSPSAAAANSDRASRAMPPGRSARSATMLGFASTVVVKSKSRRSVSPVGLLRPASLAQPALLGRGSRTKLPSRGILPPGNQGDLTSTRAPCSRSSCKISGSRLPSVFRDASLRKARKASSIRSPGIVICSMEAGAKGLPMPPTPSIAVLPKCVDMPT